MAEARPPDERDAAVEIARELVRMGSDLSFLKGEAMNWLTNPRYGPLKQLGRRASNAAWGATAE